MEGCLGSQEETGLVWIRLGGASTVTIRGYVGDVVTLTCKYDAQYYGPLSVCWGRGHIPNSGCDNEVIRTEGVKVTHSASVRYHLQGDLRAGDVSLTIIQAQMKDSGIYGCRVDIPGWFNDQKHHLALDIQPVPPDPPTVAIREISARSISVWWSAGFDGNTPITGYHLECKSQTDSWVDAVRGSNVLPWERETAINDLRPFSTYNIRMFTKNNMGLSKPSNVLTITTKDAAPDGPPQDVKLQALSSHSIKITWRAPELSLQNGLIRGYQLRYSEYSPHERLPVRVVHLMDGAESFTMNNLQEATEYSVTLHTINNAGLGPSSQELVCSTLTNDDQQHMTTTQATTEVQTEHSTSTIATTTSSTETWLLVTDSPTQGQRVDDFSTASPLSNSTTDPVLSKKLGTEEQSGHLVAILVPALVVGLLVVMAIIWQFRRTTFKKGNWNILWKNNDFLSFGDSEPAL
ncbi:unnamed protein product [Coregonus sp. 'balchen']|nr:unnamed protein product [Coregonus sp. 'balchen']